MPTYEVEMNGQSYEIDAPDDATVNLAVKQLQGQSKTPAAQEADKIEAGQQPGAFGDSAASAVMRGIPFADEMIAGLSTPVRAATDYFKGNGVDFSRAYDQSLDLERELQRRREARSPIASTIGAIGGGLGGAASLGAAASPVTSMAAPTSFVGRVGAGLADGAIGGGVYGLGAGEGTTDRLQQGATGAAIGGAVGAAFPVFSEVASRGYNAAMNSRAATQAARNAGTTPEVARMLSTVMDADGTLGAQGVQNMDRAGSEAMLADAGPNARAVLDTAIQRGGPGAVTARQAIDERVSRGAADLNTALDNTFGAPEGVFTARKSIADAAKPLLKDVYEGPAGAYAQPINYADPKGQTLQKMLEERVPGNIISEANRLMQLGGHKSQQILADIAGDGSVTFKKLPDVRQIDYITRALKQAAESGDGQGAMGGQTTLGGAYQNLSKQIRGNLRNLVPEYGVALDTASDQISRSQAIKLGGKALSPSMRTDEFADAIDGMSMAERGDLGQGIRSEIEHKVSNVTRAVQDNNMDAREALKALKELSSRANREKISLAMGDTQANHLFDQVDRIATSFELRASVAENSKTFARQATERRINDITEPGALGTLLQGKPLGAGQRIAQALTNQTPEAVNAQQNEIYSQLAQFLTRPRAQAVPAFQAMTNYGNQSLANQVRGARIAQLISGAQPLAYPTAMQLSGRTKQ